MVEAYLLSAYVRSQGQCRIFCKAVAKEQYGQSNSSCRPMISRL